MKNLTNQIQNEIKKIPSCKLQDIQNMKNRGLPSKREGYLCVFSYVVPCGSMENKKITIGIELPLNDYPRLPPHFIHLSTEEYSTEEIQKLGQQHEPYIYNEKHWITFSRPPQDIWDGLDSLKKNLHTFFESHLRRFWKSL